MGAGYLHCYEYLINGCRVYGAGGGNRTRVISLEG